MKNNQGFTLVETVIVISVLVIAMAITFFKTFYFIDNMKLKSTAQILLENIRYAQTQSLAKGMIYGIRFKKNPDRYTIYKMNSKIQQERIVYLEKGIKFLETQDDLTFNYLGYPSSGMTISLKNLNNKMLNVIVAPVAGRARISTSKI